jgi:hypothetical protein
VLRRARWLLLAAVPALGGCQYEHDMTYYVWNRSARTIRVDYAIFQQQELTVRIQPGGAARIVDGHVDGEDCSLDDVIAFRDRLKRIRVTQGDQVLLDEAPARPDRWRFRCCGHEARWTLIIE